ncbi:acetaldehyde dehydrogenase (acetylating) [Cryobacterium frigoriphilum]|uniref:Acetaldehyde dehydrogenase n=2 Tax=Cryobacterium frigoriphilum TaxID=1259150 RepID=A0A4V3IRJ2_9MICO|nr:acetaldehyde dehydrogenase (acetylating) [Cryobacterium frigoriphilum]TFD52279.1 acetaldehyde dehydrogenase (acetylating) [Cryobacterium frigoriphilum]
MSLRCAVVGSGNIGSDLIRKLERSELLIPSLLVGVDPESDGLKRARAAGIEATHEGVQVLLDRADEFDVVFEATSAHVHTLNAPRYLEAGLFALDLTPAAVGPYVVPAVNLDLVAGQRNLNMVTCGGQATVPMVAAISRVTTVEYAEIVSTISSRAAGPGTRANIDEFTETTSDALVKVGGAKRGKAIIVLNPANPPIMMRNTVFAAVDANVDPQAIIDSVNEMVAAVQAYVPGYELVSEPQIDRGAGPRGTTKVSIFLRVAGAGDYLPAYAGNLDIITAASIAAAERHAILTGHTPAGLTLAAGARAATKERI